MKRRILALILLLAMCLSLFACGDKTAQNPTETTLTPTTGPSESADPTDSVDPEPTPSAVSPLLYKVTDEAGNVLWLFGSIHIGRLDFYPLPDYVLDAYENSDALAVEFDVVAAMENMAGIMQLYQSTVYTDGTTIADHIPQELYESAVETMEELGIYNSYLDLYGPGMWADIIESCVSEEAGANSDIGIDMFFLYDAKERDKEILDIESLEYQFNISLNFSEELQIYLLEEAIAYTEDVEEYREAMEEMLDLWASGDEEAFFAYLAEEPEFADEKEKQLYEEYTNAMEVVRNDNMTQYAVDTLASGREVFICVGAAHVVGPTGMVNQLRDLGYTVELIK